MNNQNGGYRIIPSYKDDQNSPFKTKQQQEFEFKEREEKRAKAANIAQLKQEQIAPMFEIKINPELLKQQKPQVQEVYPYGIAPIQPYPFGPTMYQPLVQPITKEYNISFGGIDGNHAAMSGIYEDMLPTDEVTTKNSFNTIKERTILHNFIRNIFIRVAEGEEINITGVKRNEVINLLSRLKLLDINPYHHCDISNNPYTTLPERFIIYRSCYPIKLSQTNAIECAKSSIGLNVRVYLLSKLDEMLMMEGRFQDSDILIELNYYKYIRNDILKKKVSPNFVLMHSYYYTTNIGLNFKKFEPLRLQHKDVQIEKLKAEERNKLYKELMQKQQTGGKVPDKDLDSDKCLVLLTESPTLNITKWWESMYKTRGGIRTMISSGYHSEEVWNSVICQLLFALFTMYIKGIIFTDFTLVDNVFIKDLQFNEQNIGYWKYVCFGIEFFVPNYGYLVQIDSNFKDITSTNGKKIKQLPSETNTKQVSLTQTIDDDFSTTLKTCIHALPQEHQLKNVTITKDTTILDLLILLINSFKILHSRVGTLLYDNEKQNIGTELMIDSQTKSGSYIAYKDGQANMYFGIYIDKNQILFKDKKSKSFVVTTKSPITNYPGNIEYVYEPGKQMNLLETYIIE